jgi:hypothetical protein
MIKLIRNTFMAAALLIVVGCAGASTSRPQIARLDASMIMTPAGTSNLSPEDIESVLNRIEERNRTVEDDQEWIKASYENLMVRRLINVSSSEYPNYRKYLDDGAAYIVVHPAFFTFFHYTKKKKRRNDTEDMYKLNIVEFLLRINPSTPQFAVLQAQERRMRDFLEFKSTQKKLVIIVIPKNYNSYSGYTYRNMQDEYRRFLNEASNFSSSVLFVESRSPNRGYLTDDDAVKLMEFLLSIKADKVFVGGGYVGRCLEDFYGLITQEYGTKGIFVVPELSDISPRELNSSMASSLLQSDGLIDHEYATDLMAEDIYKVQELIPQIENLH